MDEELPERKQRRTKAPATKSKSKTKVKKKDLPKNKDVGEHSLPYLSEEVIFQILTRVPATYLHEKLRYICKGWHNLISSTEFIAQNTLRNKCELLISVPYTVNKRSYNEVKLLEMDDKMLDFNLTNVPLGRMGEIRSSCNGLVLAEDPTNRKALCVMNMLTKSSLTLRQCPACRVLNEKCRAALGFDPSAKKYKVVHMYADAFRFEFFTIVLSHNAWKRIPGPLNEKYERPFRINEFKSRDPVSINGQVFHWDVKSDEYIISMDIGDEEPRITYLPEHHKENKHRFDFLEMGGKLALLYYVSSTQIDVWNLEDFPGKNWNMKHRVMAESLNNTINPDLPDFLKLYAVAALRDGEVVMFKHLNIRYTSVYSYLYNIRKRELKKCNMHIKLDRSKFIHHRSSLIQWKNEEELVAKRLASLTSP